MAIRLTIDGEIKEFDILEKDGKQYLFPKEDLLQVPKFLKPIPRLKKLGIEESKLPDGTMVFDITNKIKEE